NTLTSTSADISARTLAVAASGQNKIYDGNVTATVTLADDRVAGDALATAYGSASFSDKNVGNAKPVSVSGISVSGADAGNYVANTSTSTSANITVRSLLISASGQNKIYDGNATAVVTLADDRVAGDALTIGFASARFNRKRVTTAQAGAVAGTCV